MAAAAIGRAVNLRLALESRDVIGQAKGVLMERHKMTEQRAFERLLAISQAMNRKLRDVAAELAETGQVPCDLPES